jgi:hypothetical protein
VNIAAIMPCRARAEQTVANVRRLLATAGYGNWRLICVCDGDRETYDVIRRELPDVVVGGSQQRQGYWRCLQQGTTQQGAGATHLISLANDLWACDDWLRLAVEDYRAAFGDGDGLLGFAGDGHGERHSCHVLISRNLLDRYGGWPTVYHHNFGDRELCLHAQQDGVYAKSTRAWLEHCHPERGLADDDAVYQEGRATYKADEALFVERRRLGWPQA